MLTLAHLSDIHLGPLPNVKRRELLSKRLIGYINWQRNRSKSMGEDTLAALVEDIKSRKPDHIAVTGDLVNLALDEEIVVAHRWLEQLGSPDNVSVVPGNHDTYVPKALDKIRIAWGRYMTGDAQTDCVFPYCRVRNDVALIGVNSGRATLPFMATGSFKSTQAKQLGKLLDAAKAKQQFRVIMIHHPPGENATSHHSRLVGASRFRKTIAQHGAELILHGHTHLRTHTMIEGQSGKVPVVGISSASQSPGPSEDGGRKHRPAASYNLFYIDKKKGEWTCELERFGFEAAGNAVVQLSPTRAVS